MNSESPQILDIALLHINLRSSSSIIFKLKLLFRGYLTFIRCADSSGRHIPPYPTAGDAYAPQKEVNKKPTASLARRCCSRRAISDIISSLPRPALRGRVPPPTPPAEFLAGSSDG